MCPCLQNYECDVTELSLDFTVTEESLGKRHIIELRPGGKDTMVTNENKLQYIHAMADYKLNRQVLKIPMWTDGIFKGLKADMHGFMYYWNVIADIATIKCIL